MTSKSASDAGTRVSIRGFLRGVFLEPPCDRCGIEGGTRWVRGEIVEVDGKEKKVKRLLCSECRKEIFLYPWEDSRKWVSW